ncbi:NADP-dependent succinic semialdehyde dehydrogenase [Actinomadura decatromicini]|uniref:NADP-dependent succinic semialdehyde dehydrogenase n=1 Tax=Actinomadura decatromicini TaxID=2604572 RepID=A0A5D3FAF0_9ACTN|nr:NADP-dependent succinic semialdehyde dehydrogenase [Actinomadura decatromicini]TYK44894.1 NADP-dependent succinic semialdehyde dehydrogenase [Actinomadura decatromicini]
MTTIATTNPATGEVEKTFDALTGEEVDRRIARAAQTFASYRTTPLDRRAGWMNAAADILDREAEQIAATMTTEMGKTLKAAEAEARKCAKACRYYAEHAAELLADRRPADPRDVDARDAYVRYEPLGPVLAVMPWNFPLWQVIRFAAPGLMAGNVGLLKHASNVPQTALFLEDLFRRAGFPEGAFQTLLIGSSQVERVLRDPRVKAATLTGSEPAGRSVASIAGSEVKTTVLELGGSDPFVVMPSADIEAAAWTAAESRCLNNGQSCISAKRFIVDIGCADEFERRFVANMRAKKVGDPLDEATDIGPLVSERARAETEELVADAVSKGAEVLCGGERPDGPGWFYPPTVVSGVTPEMRMYQEEVFAPVASLFRVRGVSEAVEVANATGFGLGSNAWTRDDDERERFVRELDAGQVFVNGMTTSYPELPFGGTKRSGYGRELSAEGMHSFCNAKTVWVG